MYTFRIQVENKMDFRDGLMGVSDVFEKCSYILSSQISDMFLFTL